VVQLLLLVLPLPLPLQLLVQPPLKQVPLHRLLPMLLWVVPLLPPILVKVVGVQRQQVALAVQVVQLLLLVLPLPLPLQLLVQPPLKQVPLHRLLPQLLWVVPLPPLLVLIRLFVQQ
jgi:hypothetical protein